MLSKWLFWWWMRWQSWGLMSVHCWWWRNSLGFCLVLLKLFQLCCLWKTTSKQAISQKSNTRTQILKAKTTKALIHWSCFWNPLLLFLKNIIFFVFCFLFFVFFWCGKGWNYLSLRFWVCWCWALHLRSLLLQKFFSLSIVNTLFRSPTTRLDLDLLHLKMKWRVSI